MYEISERLYANIAEELILAVGAKDFFSGSVVVDDGDVECRLVTTLVVSHDSVDRAVTAMLPVWWECYTTIGEYEICNDFSFCTLCEYIFS